MGCDIHVFCEVKDKEGIWHYVGEYNWDRSYTFFTAIAGVRSEITCDRGYNITPIAPLRGWPEDLSVQLQRIKAEEADYFHSLTWATPEEIFRALREVAKHCDAPDYTEHDAQKSLGMSLASPDNANCISADNLSGRLDCKNIRYLIAFDN